MKRMKVTKVMNLFCSMGNHDKCKGTSKGNSSDRETFICTCNCHTITDLDSPRVFASMGEKRRLDMQTNSNSENKEKN